MSDTAASGREGELAVSWTARGLIGRVSLAGEHWASVEWSEKRQQWCVEDVEGRCLTHVASIRGAADSKEAAAALAEAMIRDGRMPSPRQARAEANKRRADEHAEAERKHIEKRAAAMVREGRAGSLEEARTLLTRFKAEREAEQAVNHAEWVADEERRRIAREKRALQPAEQKRRADRAAQRKAQRDAEMELFRRKMDADLREQEAPPLHELLAESFDLADPELWKSNSFASLKPRLIVYLEAVIAQLEWNRYAHDRRGRLERARAILDTLKQPAESDGAISSHYEGA
jgi:hypothetical protein